MKPLGQEARWSWDGRIHLLTALVMMIVASVWVGLNIFMTEGVGMSGTARYYGFPDPFVKIDRGAVVYVQFALLSSNLMLFIFAEWVTLQVSERLGARPRSVNKSLSTNIPLPPSAKVAKEVESKRSWRIHLDTLLAANLIIGFLLWLNFSRTEVGWPIEVGRQGHQYNPDQPVELILRTPIVAVSIDVACTLVLGFVAVLFFRCVRRLVIWSFGRMVGQRNASIGDSSAIPSSTVRPDHRTVE